MSMFNAIFIANFAPVDAIDMSRQHVDVSPHHRHDPIAHFARCDVTPRHARSPASTAASARRDDLGGPTLTTCPFRHLLHIMRRDADD